MKVFIPCEDNFLDQLCPDDRLVPWQTGWADYLGSRDESKILNKASSARSLLDTHKLPKQRCLHITDAALSSGKVEQV